MMLEKIQILDFMPMLFIALFLCIVFIQSGLDKVLNFNSNLEFLKTHFQHTMFNKRIKLLLLIITLLECVTGAFLLLLMFQSFICFTYLSSELCYASIYMLSWIGLILSAITICCLFLGQRIAKDYAGAASLTFYFVIILIGMLFLFIAK